MTVKSPRSEDIGIVGDLPVVWLDIVCWRLGCMPIRWLLIGDVDPGLEANVAVWRNQDRIPPVPDDPSKRAIGGGKIGWFPDNGIRLGVPDDLTSAPCLAVRMQLADFLNEERANVDMEGVVDIRVVHEHPLFRRSRHRWTRMSKPGH